MSMILAALVVALGAGGTYLMLPHKHGRARSRPLYGGGAVASGLALLGFLTYWSPPGPPLATLFLYVFGVFAIAGAVLTVTSRNPVYSALWFASVVLSTAGLFLLADAPFLAAGTIIVYAGAIIVTFLFVIMLAQMEGRADYDRAARAPGLATFTSFVLLWCLISSLATVRTGPVIGDPSTDQGRLSPEKTLLRSRDVAAYHRVIVAPMATVIDDALTPTSQIAEAPPRPAAEGPAAEGTAGEPIAAPPESPRHDLVLKPNVAGLGASLYTDHLVTVGIAGALLFVALIGAVAIANPGRAAQGADPPQAAALRRP